MRAYYVYNSHRSILLIPEGNRRRASAPLPVQSRDAVSHVQGTSPRLGRRRPLTRRLTQPSWTAKVMGGAVASTAPPPAPVRPPTTGAPARPPTAVRATAYGKHPKTERVVRDSRARGPQPSRAAAIAAGCGRVGFEDETLARTTRLPTGRALASPPDSRLDSAPCKH